MLNMLDMLNMFNMDFKTYLRVTSLNLAVLNLIFSSAT